MPTRDEELYLPPAKYFHSKDFKKDYVRIMLYVNCAEVEVIRAPQYNELKVSDILTFVASKFNISRHLPEYDYTKEPSRELVSNLVNSIIARILHSLLNKGRN